MRRIRVIEIEPLLVGLLSLPLLVAAYVFNLW